MSLVYVLLRRVLELVMLLGRSRDFKELEIVVLRHELAILRRRSTRLSMTTVDRLFLAAASRLLPRTQWRSRHAGDAAPLASATRRLAMDVRWPPRATVHST
jgi:hypothetical protein